MTGKTPLPEHYDLLVLGSGQAGKHIAWNYASTEKTKRCAIIERSWPGGSSPNVACLPSKTLVHSAKIVYLAPMGRSLQWGIGQGIPNTRAATTRKVKMTEELEQSHAAETETNGVEVIWGQGKFSGEGQIEVQDERGESRILKAEKVVICTGSRPAIPDIEGLLDAAPLTHVDIVHLDEVPLHLIILGGGHEGMELAHAMKRFGAQITVVEVTPQVLKDEDADVAAVLREALEKDGVLFVTSISITSVYGTSGKSIVLNGTDTTSGKPVTYRGSHILCATGRIPNTDNINASLAGLQLSAQGHIVVDEQCRATANGTVFAVGDCAGSPHYTHISYDDFRIVRDVLASKNSATSTSLGNRRRSDRQVPFTLYTDPEFAHVGWREHELKAVGTPYRLAKVPMTAFLRTRTLGETTGFAKALIGPHDEILGFSAVGSGVGELLPVIQLAMKKSLPYTEIAELVIAHPTMGEGLVALFTAVPGKGG